MEQRRYSHELLQAISQGQKNQVLDGLPMLVKPIPDDNRPGVLDPRLYASMAEALKVAADPKTQMPAPPKTILETAYRMRDMMNGIKSIPISAGVNTSYTAVKTREASIPVRIYTPAKQAAALVPVFYYIHGGGFVAGSPDVVEEMCKQMVEKTGCVAVTPEYRLAPEYPFPASLEDCWAVLEWLHQNAPELGGNPDKICVSGDSAGGNLATVCAMKDRDLKTGMVKIQALFYPSVNISSMQQTPSAAPEIEISTIHRPAIEALLDVSGMMGEDITLAKLLGVQDESDPYVSSYCGELAGMPPAILLFGEYDFLREENTAYARKLIEAGVETRIIFYRGMGHGFSDQVGVTPQAEDSLAEVAAFMMEHLG